MTTLDKNTIRLEHMQGQQLIEAIQEQMVEGTVYTVVIQVEQVEQDIKKTDIHPLAEFLLENHPFHGISEKINAEKCSIRDSMGETMASHFDNK